MEGGCDFGFWKSKSGKLHSKKAGWPGMEDLRILKKGVGGFFAGHGGGGAVAGVDSGFVGKGKNLFTDAGKQQVAVAAGQVPATHAIRKKHVPSKNLVSGGKIETKASRAVAGYVEEPGIGPSIRDRAGFVEELGGLDRAKPLRQAKSEHGVGFEAKKRGIGMVVDRATSPFREVGGVPDVIPMAVSEQ